MVQAMTPPFPHSVTELLQRLVRTPSVNPDGATEKEHDFCGEQKIARDVAVLLREMGAEVSFDEVLEGRPNVIGRFPCGTDEPKVRLLLAPHLDTVGISGMTIDPFAAEVRDGRVWGRGSSDTKGTAAAMLWCLHEMSDELANLDIEVTFVGLMGEETGQPGSIDFGERYGDHYDFAIVGEPTDCQFVNAHKGCVWLEVAMQGQAAHASTPEKGNSALLNLAELSLTVMRDFQAELVEKYSHPLLGAPTINLGQFSSGTRPNIVPDRARAVFDMRITPALFDADPVKLLKQFMESRSDEQFHLYEICRCAPMLTDGDNEVLSALQRGTGADLVTAPWFCDGAHLGVAGIPSVAAGPGSIAQAHTADEYLAIDDLEAGVRFYRQCIEAVAGI